MRRSSVPPAGTVLALAAALAWLRALGDGTLGPPPWSDPAALLPWVDAHGPAVAAFALVRQAAILVALYLLAVIALGWVVRVLRLARAQRVLDRVTAPAIRRLVAHAASAGLASAVVLAAAPAGAAPPQPGVAVIHLLDDPTPTTSAPSPPEAPVAPAGTASVRPLDAPARDETWTVAPGDSFWHVARSHLEDLTGVAPTDAEITRYWRTLIEANRAGLPDPLNPDLLFASAVLVLPPA